MAFIVIGFLILLNGFFALSEIALVSSKKSRLEQLKSEGRKGAKYALKLLENSENFLSAVQVGITLIGIITGVYGGINIAENLSPVFEQIGFIQNSAYEITMAITVFTITYFSIVIGELVPKKIALNNPEGIAVKISPSIYYFSKLFHPFVWFLAVSTNLFTSLLGIKKKTTHVTEMELRHILKTATSEGVIEKEQNLIHERLFYFADKKARHLMTHRMDIEWIDINKEYSNIRSDVLGSRHSKVVCCYEELDNFKGLLHIKDYLTAIAKNEPVNICDLLVQPLVVTESMGAVKLWRLFRQKQIYTAIVVNEYGSFEGLITLHDIMENIMGEIPEEGENTEPDIFVRDDKSFLISGDAPAEILDGIFEGFTTDFEEIDYSTVAGFVLSNINKIPQIGDKFDFKGFTIEVIDIDGNRIDKILIRQKVG
jgi:putative hemolysin